jgi:hypothetical protein
MEPCEIDTARNFPEKSCVRKEPPKIPDQTPESNADTTEPVRLVSGEAL